MAADAAEDEWGRLMAAAQDGHGGAYRRLLGEVRGWLLRFYARRLPPGLVEDAVQDTLIAIHQKRHPMTAPVRSNHGWVPSRDISGSTACAP